MTEHGTALMERSESAPMQLETLEKIVQSGDLSGLSWKERWAFYLETCRVHGLDPASRPFDFIEKGNKVTLYANKEAAAQITRRDGISIVAIDDEIVNTVYRVKVTAQTKDGRTSMNIGAISIANKGGDVLANAMMHAVTKAIRRVTLMIGGLGHLDETEVETIAGATLMHVNEIGAEPQREQLPAPEKTKPTGSNVVDMRANKNEIPPATPAQKDTLESIFVELAALSGDKRWGTAFKRGLRELGLPENSTPAQLNTRDAQALLAWGTTQRDIRKNSLPPAADAPEPVTQDKPAETVALTF